MNEHRVRPSAANRPGSVTRYLHRVQAGAAGGLLGAVAVAALFFLQGALALHPLTVPAALASALFSGGSAGSGAAGSLGSYFLLPLEILAYTVVHVTVFAAVGASAALVLNGSGFWRSLAGGVAYTSVTCTGLLYLVLWFADTPVALDVLGLPRVLLANALAGAIIGTALYLVDQGDDRAMPASSGT